MSIHKHFDGNIPSWKKTVAYAFAIIRGFGLSFNALTNASPRKNAMKVLYTALTAGLFGIPDQICCCTTIYFIRICANHVCNAVDFLCLTPESL